MRGGVKNFHFVLRAFRQNGESWEEIFHGLRKAKMRSFQLCLTRWVARVEIRDKKGVLVHKQEKLR